MTTDFRDQLLTFLEKAGEKPHRQVLHEALQIATGWCKAEKENPRAFLQAGNLYKQLDQINLAIEAYQKACKIFADNDKTIQQIAVNKMILDLDPQNELVKEQLQVLGRERETQEDEIILPTQWPPPTPLFSSLSPDALGMLLQHVKFRALKPGDILCKEGDPGDCIYVLSQGKVAIRAHDKEMAQLDEGSFFGEFAYFTDAKRHASVVALDHSEVLELHRQTMENLTKDFPEVDRTLREFYQQRVIDMLIAESELFSSLSDRDRGLLIMNMKPLQVKANTTLLIEGDPGDTFYFIQTGEVEVYREKGGEKILLARLDRGNFFGELAFLNNHRRVASVRTLTDCQLFSLPCTKMQEMVVKYPKVKAVLEETARQRLEAVKMAKLPARLV